MVISTPFIWFWINLIQGHLSASPFFGNLVLYYTTVDRKTISVDVKLSAAHAFNKAYVQKFSKFGPNCSCDFDMLGLLYNSTSIW